MSCAEIMELLEKHVQIAARLQNSTSSDKETKTIIHLGTSNVVQALQPHLIIYF